MADTIPVIELTPEDEDWLKTLDGGRYKRADLAAQEAATKAVKDERFKSGLSRLMSLGKSEPKKE